VTATTRQPEAPLSPRKGGAVPAACPSGQSSPVIHGVSRSDPSAPGPGGQGHNLCKQRVRGFKSFWLHRDLGQAGRHIRVARPALSLVTAVDAVEEGKNAGEKLLG
jgi:hypothetical protein